MTVPSLQGGACRLQPDQHSGLTQQSSIFETPPPLATLNRLRHHFQPLVDVLYHAVGRVCDRMIRPVELAGIVHDQLQVVDARLDGHVLVVSELCLHCAEIHRLLDDAGIGGEFQSLVIDRSKKISSILFLLSVADLRAKEGILSLSHGVGAPSCFARPFDHL